MLFSACEYTNLLQIAARVPLKRSGSHSTCLGYLEAFTKSVLSVLCQKKILLNTFLDVLMADPPPQCLVWIPLMHRLANVENGTWFFISYFSSPTASGHLAVCNCLCAAVPQSSIQWNALIAGMRAWWVSATAASSAMATSFVRAASGVVMPAVPIATSTKWRSTPHGYVHPKMEIRPQIYSPSSHSKPVFISFFQETQKEMLCKIFKLFFSL